MTVENSKVTDSTIISALHIGIYHNELFESLKHLANYNLENDDFLHKIFIRIGSYIAFYYQPVILFIGITKEALKFLMFFECGWENFVIPRCNIQSCSLFWTNSAKYFGDVGDLRILARLFSKLEFLTSFLFFSLLFILSEQSLLVIFIFLTIIS